MNAISFLIKEHDKVRAVFANIADESHRFETKTKMFEEVSQELIRHETMEETIWYPRLVENEDLQKIIQHLITEEKDASKAIAKLKKLDEEKEWIEAFLKLKKDVEHHANEEESKLFPKVENLLQVKELEGIGEEMYAFKQEFKQDQQGQKK